MSHQDPAPDADVVVDTADSVNVEIPTTDDSDDDD
jgi:hypothetical protein